MLHFLHTEGKTLHQKTITTIRCGGLEPKPQYVQGMPVVVFFILSGDKKPFLLKNVFNVALILFNLDYCVNTFLTF